MHGCPSSNPTVHNLDTVSVGIGPLKPRLGQNATTETCRLVWRTKRRPLVVVTVEAEGQTKA